MWTNIGIKLLVGGLCVDADELRMLAVYIVLNGTTTVVLRMFELVWELHHYAVA